MFDKNQSKSKAPVLRKSKITPVPRHSDQRQYREVFYIDSAWNRIRDFKDDDTVKIGVQVRHICCPDLKISITCVMEITNNAATTNTINNTTQYKNVLH